MASGAAAIAAPIFASVPVVGWAVGIAAAYVDAAYLLPALRGRGRDNARPNRLLEVPVGSNQPGAPRIWALGTRVRVPTHVLWQSEKIRETTQGGSKGGLPANTIRRTFIKALVSLNDRPTLRLSQLFGNGALLTFATRNLFSITTSNMTATLSGSDVLVTMSSTLDPDFADLLAVNSYCYSRGWIILSGPDINEKHWRVKAVTPHLPNAPSTVTLEPADAQSVASLNVLAGTQFSPASLIRIDDALLTTPSSFSLVTGSGGSEFRVSGFNRPVNEVFRIGDEVKLFRADGTVYSLNLPVSGFVGTTTIRLSPIAGGSFVAGSLASGAHPRIVYARQDLADVSLFPPGFDPIANFYRGDEAQGENPLVADDKGAGNVPGYRGVAYQALDDFRADEFGGQLPPALEAVIDPDAAMGWSQAVREVLKRGGVPDSAIDTQGVNNRPFDGMYLRGAVPALAAIQPMIVAGQLLGQERDGTICIFELENADVVQVENGAVFSDFGAVSSGDTPQEKVFIEDSAAEDLPTSIGVRHQDPNAFYSEAYQHFGLRAPQGVSHRNEQELDLSNMVLTRQQARNLAATVLRRAWINRRTYRFSLPCAYIDLLENDLVTWTDDEGTVITARIIQRDIGSDFRVAVTALAEDVNVAVSGSPVQTGADGFVPALVPPALLRTAIIDAPAITTAEAQNPAIKIAVCAEGGSFAGAQVWESIDSGSYVQVGSIGSQAVIGTLETALTAQASSEAPGSVTLRAQTVDVLLSYEGDTPLEACTQAQAELGRNWVCIQSAAGTELAAFTTVTPQGDGVYTLGGWLRGLRGTRSPEHAVGATLTLVWPSGQGGILRREYSGDVVGATIDYKVVPTGASLDDVTATQITFAGANAKPLPVIVNGFASLGSNNLRLSWDHRSREVVAMGSSPPFPMDEPVESYRVDIYDPTGATLLRQKYLSAQGTGSPVLLSATVDYPASEQTADGYTPGVSTEFWLDVVQLGQHGESPSVKAEYGIS